MARLAQTPGLTDVQRSILETVREFADKEIIPHAQQLEKADEYPADILAGMREMGLFGLTIDEEYGGLGESLLTYALVVEELSRGWMSISGIVNTHFIVAYLISKHGSAEQKAAAAAEDGHRRGAGRVLDVGAGVRFRRLGDQVQGRPGRRRLRPQRPEDVADQRGVLLGGGDPGQDRHRRRLGLRQHEHLPAGEGAGLRRDRPGPDHPRQDRKDGLQGRRDHRDDSRRGHGARHAPSSAAPTRSAAASTR